MNRVPAAFWSRLAAAEHRLLMLDYDGTLAPFQVRREAVRSQSRSLHLLTRIASGDPAPDGGALGGATATGGAAPAAGHTTVAIVSGRTLAELDRLAGHLPAILVGEHGWDVRRPGRGPVRHPLPENSAAALDRAAAAATAAGFAEHLERKRCSIVLHTRGLPADRAEAMAHACAVPWAREAADGALRLDRVDGGVELRAAGRDKGTAVRELLAAAPPDTLAVYIGDDITDEDAFREVAPRGFGLRVGPVDRPTHAAGHLPSAAAVETFLIAWLATDSDEPARHLQAGMKGQRT